MKLLQLLKQCSLIGMCLFWLPISVVYAAGSSSAPSSAAPQIDPVVEYKKGIKHLNAQRYKKAERAFRKVLKVSKKNANTHYVLALAYIGQDKLPKARKSLVRAVKYDADMAEARGRLAYVYNKLGDTENAVEQKQILLDQQAKCGDCEKQAAIAKALAIIEGSSAALFDLQELMDTHAGDLAYIEAIGLINRGSYKEALALLAKAAKAFGPHPDVLTYQGFANRKMGQKEQAYRFYQAALTVDPQHRGANEYLGEYFVEMNNLPAAKDQLATLHSICHFGCEEAEELGRWITAAES